MARSTVPQYYQDLALKAYLLKDLWAAGPIGGPISDFVRQHYGYWIPPRNAWKQSSRLTVLRRHP